MSDFDLQGVNGVVPATGMACKRELLEPIAIVGMAFRFPGGIADGERFWQVLREGQDVVTEVDASRWATDWLQHPKRVEPGRSITFSAGVLERIQAFDAEFFGISPREAVWLDPQQRLLLELAWEAMENGGLLPSRLAGSDCAVYVGISGLDYGIRGLDDLSSLGAYTMTGNTLSLAANRLSYVFDLHGPSLAVDTACSSSLVALHHACQSLRAGDASMALVGGVNLLQHPYPFIGFTKAGMLSAGGRCRAFDDAGDGYVRAEGGAVLLLKPLRQAMADGDAIEAVIRATGANADGARKSGLTIPSRDGQIELMQSVLACSGLVADEVDFVEAHGTGTAVGDPVEAAAIGAVYGQSRGAPLSIGSVKTNMGHLEPASGMAGLVKAVLVLQHRQIPPSLHLEHPNAHIDFAGLNLDVVTEMKPLCAPSGRLPAVGVNSFGFGGANAHVLLQAVPVEQRTAHNGSECPPLLLSARSDAALMALAGQYLRRLEETDIAGYYDIAFAAALQRDRLACGLAIAVDSLDSVRAGLQGVVQGDVPTWVVRENRLPVAGKLAFVYAGNGAQWQGMGLRLMAESSRFAALMQHLDLLMAERAGFSILQALQATVAHSRLDDTAVAQPLLFAIQVALTQWLQEQGVEPDAVAGHSVGEVVAAWVAGALTLTQAIDVICARSASQALTRGCGRMAAVACAEQAVLDAIHSLQLMDVAVVGYNSPSNLTLAGSLSELQRLQQYFDARQVFFRLLDLDYAFHSAHMDRIRQGLLDSLASLRPAQTNRALFVSSVTGGVLAGAELGAHYWWRNVREPVRFATAIQSLAEVGCRTFVEIGPHAILQRYLNECLAGQDEQAVRVLPTLHRQNDGVAKLRDSMLRLHLSLETTRREVWFPVPGNRVILPNYPWQREMYGLPQTIEGYHLIERQRVHPLLGWRLKDTDVAWENVLDPVTLPWLSEHRVGGAIVLPGAAYCEMALAAAREWQMATQLALEDLDIISPMVFDGEHGRNVRMELQVRDGSFTIRSRQRLSGDDWQLHAMGRVVQASGIAQGRLPVLPARSVLVEATEHYRLTEKLGLQYGPIFRGIERLQLGEDVLEAQIAFPLALADGTGDARSAYGLHPAILDLCFQSLVDFFAAEINEDRGVAFLPVRVGRLSLRRMTRPTGFRVHLLRHSFRSVLADFVLTDAQGAVVAEMSGCRFRAAPLLTGKSTPDCWQIVPLLKPHRLDAMTSSVPDLPGLSDVLRIRLLEIEPQRAAWFQEGFPLFDALALTFVYRALDGFGTGWLQRVCLQPDSLPVAVQPVFHWLSTVLQQEGLLRQEDGDGWQLLPSDLPMPEDIWRTLLRDFPASLSELLPLGRVGMHLPALLAGEEDAVALAAAVQQGHVAEMQADESPALAGIRYAIETVLRHVAAHRLPGRRLRVLEVVTGVSALSQCLVDVMVAGELDYVLVAGDDTGYVTEPHDKFGLVLAEMADDGALSARWGRLPQVFDIIVLRHSLHARNAPVVLSMLRQRLADGGLLLLAERYPDLAAGLVAGVRSMALAQEIPVQVTGLMAPSAWQKLLEAQGFERTELFVEPAAPDSPTGAWLMLARPAAHVVEPELPVQSGWLIVTGDREAAVPLATRLQGQVTEILVLADNESAALRQLRQKLTAYEHVLYLAHTVRSDDSDSGVSRFTAVLGLFHLAQVMQGLSGTQDKTVSPRLWIVTRGGALLTDDPHLERIIEPDQAAVWGLGRVLMNEMESSRPVLIDLAQDGDFMLPQLVRELLWPDDEQEVVLVAQGRYALRMQTANIGQTGVVSSAESLLDDSSLVRLDFLVPGQLRNLVWLPQSEVGLPADGVELRPMATGLNFRDVMYVMGLLPDEAVEKGFAGASLGLECAGVVTRVGSAVRGFSPGDAVMGFGAACFASRVVTSANAITHKPALWSYEAAATVPTVFFTVYYALKQLADVRVGERVLIHGGAGGVGIAAIQLATYLGAEVFVTAGSAEKRDFVRLLGADHVFDSRSLDFADEILALTGGEGVDVVLNSLAGEAMRRNLRVLRPFGRFLELGKRDFFENTSVGLRPFKDNISYFGIDADQLLIARPEMATRLFGEVMALFHAGALTPLPFRAFGADRVVDAFRTMQQSRHIGKVVLTLVDNKRERISASRPLIRQWPLAVQGSATWLVTGGLAGFGLETARWLVRQGVTSLALVGRRGLDTPGAREAVAALRAEGTQVTVFAVDVAQAEAMQAMMARIRSSLPPLKGVVHAAMVLDDALLPNLDANRMLQVLAPKVLGAWHLHQLTRDLPLEHFVLYSSVTTFIGNPGQANYVAANAWLEGLAAQRQAQGLPATCLAWGAIDDAGYLTRHASVKDILTTRMGVTAMKSAQALEQLGQALALTAPVSAIGHLDWTALSRALPSFGSTRFTRLAQAHQAGNQGKDMDIRAALAGRTAAEALLVVQGFVLDEVAQILCMAADRIDPARSLHELGMDSLMAVELALGLEKRCGVRLPAMLLNEGPTVERVSVRIVEKLHAGSDALTESGIDNTAEAMNHLVEQVVAQHGEAMSASELAQTVLSVRELQSGNKG